MFVRCVSLPGLVSQRILVWCFCSTTWLQMWKGLLFQCSVIFITVGMWNLNCVVTTFSSPVIGKASAWSLGKAPSCKKPSVAHCLGNICITPRLLHVITTMWMYLLTVGPINTWLIPHTSRYLIIPSPWRPSCHYKPVIAPRWKIESRLLCR